VYVIFSYGYQLVQYSGIPRNFVQSGVQQIQLRTGDRENGDLGAVAPLFRGSGGSCNWYKKFHFI